MPTRWRDGLAEDAGAKVAFQIVEIVAANSFIMPRGVEQRLGGRLPCRDARD